MKKLFTILLVLVVSFGTSSCVNFIEKIFFNENGSGTYTFTLDMSEMKSLAEMSGEDISSETIMDEINFDDNDMVQKLNKIEGLSKVSTEFDDDNFSLTIGFDFKDINALNVGMSTYLADSTKLEIEMFDFFSIKKNKITRLDINPTLDTFQKQMSTEAEEEEATLDMMKMMFSDLYYSSVITTAKKIKSFSSKEYTSKGDNSISWIFYPFQNENAKKDISVTLKTK